MSGHHAYGREPPATRRRRRPFAAAALLSIASVLMGCGGSDADDVTFIVGLALFDETNSFIALRKQLGTAGIAVKGYQCGYEDSAKYSPGMPSIHVEGRTPRLIYVTVSYDDGQRASRLGIQTLRFWAGVNLNIDSDPFDCGPLPTGPE